MFFVLALVGLLIAIQKTELAITVAQAPRVNTVRGVSKGWITPLTVHFVDMNAHANFRK